MNLVLPILVTLIAGIGIAVQAPTNAVLGKASGSALLAALVSFLVGTAALVALWATVDRTSPSTLKGVPAWAWLGGFYGAAFVTAAAYATPRLGLAFMLTVAIAAQLAAALAIDHFGWLGLKAEPISVVRVAGLLLVIGGVVLVRRG